MVYALVGSVLTTTAGAAGLVVSLTHTPSALSGAVISLMYQSSIGPMSVAISSIVNQSSTSISFFEAAGAYVDTNSSFAQRVVYIPSFPAGTTAVTINMANTAGNLTELGFEYREYSGLSTNGIDVSIGNPDQTAPAGSDGVTSTTATPTGASPGAMLFGFSGSYSAFESCTAGTGFGNYNAPVIGGQGASEDRRITNNSAVAATFAAATVGNSYSTQMMVIDELSTATAATPFSIESMDYF